MTALGTYDTGAVMFECRLELGWMGWSAGGSILETCVLVSIPEFDAS